MLLHLSLYGGMLQFLHLVMKERMSTKYPLACRHLSPPTTAPPAATTPTSFIIKFMEFIIIKFSVLQTLDLDIFRGECA